MQGGMHQDIIGLGRASRLIYVFLALVLALWLVPRNALCTSINDPSYYLEIPDMGSWGNTYIFAEAKAFYGPKPTVETQAFAHALGSGDAGAEAISYVSVPYHLGLSESGLLSGIDLANSQIPILVNYTAEVGFDCVNDGESDTLFTWSVQAGGYISVSGDVGVSPIF